MRREWTTTEAARLHALRDLGWRMQDIADLFGRSVDSLYAFLRYVPANGSKPCGRQSVPVRTKRPPQSPSERLRIATITAIARYANDNALALDVAAHRLLSRGVS